MMTWILSSIGLVGLGLVIDEMLGEIETNTFVGNHNVSLNAGIGLALFAIGFFRWISVGWLNNSRVLETKQE